MEMNKKIHSETEYLFNCDFQDKAFDPENHEEHLKHAEALLRDCPKNQVRDCWLSWLYNRCEAPEEVVNFCNLFVYYGGSDLYIPDPYKLAGYLYYRVDMDVYWDEASTIFESIIIPVFERQGLANLMNDPSYRPDKDSKILEAAERWMAGKYDKT